MPDEAVASPPLCGLHCPRCGAKKTGVLQTRAAKPGTIRRRRICKQCKHRMTTLEAPKERWAKPFDSAQ